MTQDTMDSRGDICVKLPLEIIERVMSFLPVPVLCRMRSVCKRWNELIARPSFHDLCDHNGRNNVCLFVWREHWRGSRGSVSPIFTGTLTFLELNAMRWYSIQATELPKVCACGNEIETRVMVMDNCLVCELTSQLGTDRNFALTLSDPVAKTRRTLPAPSEINYEPHLVTVVDDVTRSYKVYLFHNCFDILAQKYQLRVYVHESLTSEWRGLRNVPNEEGLSMGQGMGMPYSSAVVFNQTVHVVNLVYRDLEYDQLSLLSHKPQDDTWAEVWRMSFRREVDAPILVVSDNRLFVMVWLAPVACKRKLPVPPGCDCPNSESLFQTNHDEPSGLIEIYEILIAEKSRKPVLQLTDAQVRQIFDTHFYVDVAYAYPCLDSYGICNSVVLVSLDGSIEKVRRYHLATRAVDALPPHPLVQIAENPAPVFVEGDALPYDAKTMKLSLRNLLAQRPKTSMGWRLLQ